MVENLNNILPKKGVLGEIVDGTLGDITQIAGKGLDDILAPITQQGALSQTVQTIIDNGNVAEIVVGKTPTGEGSGLQSVGECLDIKTEEISPPTTSEAHVRPPKGMLSNNK